MEGLNLRPDDNELFRLRVRQGSEQGGVVNGKDGCICADAQGQGEENR